MFAPTGSMANVLALAALVGPGQEVLCESRAHILRAELGAHGAFTGLTSRTWVDEQGQIDLDAIRSMHAPDMGPFFVRTTAISVENTHNFAGGTVLPLADLEALRALADELGCGVHMDGARIWNAHVATGTPLTSYGAVADTMAVCLSKGLGAPIGSLMLGSSDQIAEARVQRKRMGGGMRQVGVLAAAGLYALDRHLDRMAEDHEHARLLAEACGLDPVAHGDEHRRGRRTRRTRGRRGRPRGERARRRRRPPPDAPAHPPRRLPVRRRAGRRGARQDPEDRVAARQSG